MGPGGIATIIAACSLFVVAVAISYAVIRIGRLIDEAKISLKLMTDEAAPLITNLLARSSWSTPLSKASPRSLKTLRM